MLKKQLRIILAVSTSLLCLSTAYSGHPTTFVGPTARLGYTSPLTDNTAFSLLGEAGAKNYRVGGTLGWRIDENSRIKLSGEYLWQKLTYSFSTGGTDEWVQQGALGAGYQYNFLDVRLKPSIDLDAYFSQARSKNLSNIYGFSTLSPTVIVPFTEVRRIAGSHARGISPGVSIGPWWGSRIGVALDFDQIRYDTKFISDVTASGLGGTAYISQALTDNVSLYLTGSDRKIFNTYEADLMWSNVQFYGNWTVGAFGNYTTGKKSLLNTYNIGLSANYFMEPCARAPLTNLKGERNLKGEVPAAPTDDFLPWTANPAVYMPQVLAIVDPRFISTNTCPPGSAPTALAIPDFSDISGDIVLTPFFTGANLTYTVTVDGPIVPGDFVSISGNVLSYSAFEKEGPYDVTVTATNACGSATSNTFGVGSPPSH